MITTLTEPQNEAQPLEQHLAAFETFEIATAASTPIWLRAVRTSGISYFAELGFPGPEAEDFRFLNLAPITKFPFQAGHKSQTGHLTSEDVAPFSYGGMTAHRLVFVDGHFQPKLSSLQALPPGVIISDLGTAIHKHGALVEPHLGRHARHEQHPFIALNTAFIQDGAFIHVPKRCVIPEPVHLLFIASQPGTAAQPRNLIVAGPESRVHVIEDYVSLASAAYWNNVVTEIVAGQAAQVEHLKIQREHSAALHVATVEIHQDRDSRVVSHSISLGARLARNDINLRFRGEACESILNGLYLANGDQVVDHHTVADHIKPHCASHEFYHGILGGRAKGVFNGKIFVRPNAQKTNAKQTNKNLLLSNEATINTKPQLEIFADDVKCTHGATVGQLDETAVFYLRSRGIGEALARQMLIKAFASDVLNRIEIDPVREELDQLLSLRLER